MRIDALRSSYSPITRIGVNDTHGSGQQNRSSGRDLTPPHDPPRRRSATPEQLSHAITQFVSLSQQASADGVRGALPLASQRALDAYVGTRREEERRFLHEVMGIDTYA